MAATVITAAAAEGIKKHLKGERNLSFLILRIKNRRGILQHYIKLIFFRGGI